MDTINLLSDIFVVAGSIFLRFLFIAGSIYLLLKTFNWTRKYMIYKVPLSKGQISWEIKTAIIICLFDGVILAGANYLEILPNGEATWQNFFLTFGGIFIWFESSLYFTHRLLHTKHFYWIHKRHHMSKVTTPFSAISSSLLDRGIGAVVPFIPVFFLDSVFGIEASRTGIIAYFTLLFCINIYTHLNVEIIPQAIVRNKWIRSMLITPSYHALHHARHRGNYGITTPLMDVLFDTYFPDYEKVHKKSRKGEGMKRLGERLTPKEHTAVKVNLSVKHFPAEAALN